MNERGEILKWKCVQFLTVVATLTHASDAPRRRYCTRVFTIYDKGDENKPTVICRSCQTPCSSYTLLAFLIAPVANAYFSLTRNVIWIGYWVVFVQKQQSFYNTKKFLYGGTERTLKHRKVTLKNTTEYTVLLESESRHKTKKKEFRWTRKKSLGKLHERVHTQDETKRRARWSRRNCRHRQLRFPLYPTPSLSPTLLTLGHSRHSFRTILRSLLRPSTIPQYTARNTVSDQRPWTLVRTMYKILFKSSW